MVPVLLGAVVFSLWAAWLCFESARWSRIPSPRHAEAPKAGRGVASLHGEVLFAQRLGPGRIALDCMVRGRGDTGPSQPVHLQVAGASVFGGAASLEELVLRWIGSGRRVWAAVIVGAHPRVSLSEGHSLVVLDLQSIAPVGRLSYQAARGPIAS